MVEARCSSVGGTGSDRYRGWAQGSEVRMLNPASNRHRLTESYAGSQKLEGRSALKTLDQSTSALVTYCNLVGC